MAASALVPERLPSLLAPGHLCLDKMDFSDFQLGQLRVGKGWDHGNRTLAYVGTDVVVVV